MMTYVASRAYRAARREAEELEDVEVGVMCHVFHVSPVTYHVCHVSRVTMMLVSVSSCYNRAPGHHPRLPPPQCPLHHREGDDRCGHVNTRIYTTYAFVLFFLYLMLLQTFLCC